MFDSRPAGESIQSHFLTTRVHVEAGWDALVPECDRCVLTRLKNRTEEENTPGFCFNSLNTVYVKAPWALQWISELNICSSFVGV